jgi:hypothetical protein
VKDKIKKFCDRYQFELLMTGVAVIGVVTVVAITKDVIDLIPRSIPDDLMDDDVIITDGVTPEGKHYYTVTEA